MPVVGQRLADEIKAYWMFQVSGIEIYRFLDAMSWYVIQQFRGKIAMWIYDPDAVAGDDVLQDQISKKLGLASAAFADGGEVMLAVMRRQNKGLFLPPFLPHPQDRVPLLHVLKRASTPKKMPSSAFMLARASSLTTCV